MKLEVGYILTDKYGAKARIIKVLDNSIDCADLHHWDQSALTTHNYNKFKIEHDIKDGLLHLDKTEYNKQLIKDLIKGE